MLGPVPVIYPFIVNNPGEAAQAKRGSPRHYRPSGPPLRKAGQHGAAAEIEALFDEYAIAASLDPGRAPLAQAILDRATETGLSQDANVKRRRSAAALDKLDAWLCDLKDMRIGDGLHVFGRAAPAHPSATTRLQA